MTRSSRHDQRTSPQVHRRSYISDPLDVLGAQPVLGLWTRLPAASTASATVTGSAPSRRQCSSKATLPPTPDTTEPALGRRRRASSFGPPRSTPRETSPGASSALANLTSEHLFPKRECESEAKRGVSTSVQRTPLVQPIGLLGQGDFLFIHPGLSLTRSLIFAIPRD